MWIFVIICFIGMAIFFASACTIALVYKDIEKRLRIAIGITSVTMILGMMSLLLGYASIILTIFVLATFFPKEKKCNEYIYLETQEKHYEKK